jgi:hypothetical protein
MIEKLAKLLFGCRHRHMSLPMTLVRKPGMPPSEGFVVCLDCGKRYVYDMSKMTLRKPLREIASN